MQNYLVTFNISIYNNNNLKTVLSFKTTCKNVLP